LLRLKLTSGQESQAKLIQRSLASESERTEVSEQIRNHQQQRRGKRGSRKSTFCRYFQAANRRRNSSVSN
jgi:hypothetical protein